MKHNLCKDCHFYRAYYTKGYNRYNDTRHGFCNKHHIEKKEKETCEFWQDNERRREATKRRSLETLEEAINYIRDIAQILKEDAEEEK